MLAFWLLLLSSFAGTFYALPHSIRKLREKGYLAKDMYKEGMPLLPTNAGMIILFTSFISISLLPLMVRVLNSLPFLQDTLLYSLSPMENSVSDLSETNLALLLVVSIYALYGLVDDLLDIGRKLKLILPVTFGYPLISVVNPDTIWLPLLGNFDLLNFAFGNVTWGDMFRVIVIPVYVMVVANLVNMHSGYNGLQSGLSIIIITTLLIKSWSDGILSTVLPSGALLGSMLALWCFNKYPAKVFEGNIGSLLFGSLMGSIIIIQEYWWLGFFILIPHTFNFLLWIIWLLLMRKKPDIYLDNDGQHRKFGYFDKNTKKLVVPNTLTLKWVPSKYLGYSEKESVNVMYMVTLFFCISGFFLF